MQVFKAFCFNTSEKFQKYPYRRLIFDSSHGHKYQEHKLG